MPYYRNPFDQQPNQSGQIQQRQVFPVPGAQIPTSSQIGLPRSGGRSHQGVDIFAPRGAKVVAFKSGIITGNFSNSLGGNKVTVLGDDGNYYYYAHLDSIDPRILSGQVRRLEAGEFLGTVGNSGNASGGGAHLHFSINEGRGNVIDPVPLFSGAAQIPISAVQTGGYVFTDPFSQYPSSSSGANVMAEPVLTEAELQAEVRKRYGYLSAFLDHPELGPLLQNAAQNQWDVNRLRGELSKTIWWQTTEEATRQWESLKGTDQKEAEAKLDGVRFIVTQAANNLGLTLSPERLLQISENSIKFAWSEEEVQSALVAEFQYDPQSPPIGTLGSVINEVNRRAGQYLIHISDSEIKTWAQRIASGYSTYDALNVWLSEAAKSKFGALGEFIDMGITPRSYFEDHINSMAQILEVPVESIDLLNNPQYSKILEIVDTQGSRRPMTISESQEYARSLPQWQTTRNANASGAGLETLLLEEFGKARF